MKFDIVCAREILLTLEKKEYDCSISFVELNNSLPSFSSAPLTVQYHCLKLEEVGYIKLERKHFGARSSDFIERITDMTANGHEYLSNLIQSEGTQECSTIKTKQKSLDLFIKLLSSLPDLIKIVRICLDIFQFFPLI